MASARVPRLVLLAALTSGCAIAMHRGADGERGRVGREIRDSLATVLRTALSDSAFPGAYAIVGDSKGVLAEFGVGQIDWGRSPRPDRHTLWDLASLTKVVGTTTAMAQLVERGEVSLDAPAQQYLPDWIGPGQESVTVRHLLTHRSGLPSFRPYDTLTHNPDSLAVLLYRTGLERSPGQRMVYSDIGAFIMGRIVVTISGMPLDRYLEARVFAPLGMRETLFNPDASLRARVAPTEVDTLRGGLVHGAVHDERAYYLGGTAAHAGLFSSAADLSRFASMMLRGGTLDSARVLSAETIGRFTQYVDSSAYNRGLGWQKPDRPEMRDKTPSAAWAGRLMSSRAYGHTGFTGTSIAIDPAIDLYVILLSNRVNPTRRNNKIGAVRPRVADAVVSVVLRHRGQTINAETP